LVGSLTEGFFNKNSDIDIAILFKGRVNLERELSLGVALEKTLGRKVDIINLNRAYVNLAFLVISKDILIHERDYIYHSNFLRHF